MKALIDNKAATVLINTGAGQRGEKGADGKDGEAAEFRASGGFLQWRLVGDSSWHNLVPLSDLKGDKGENGDAGADGADGLQVELRKSLTAIQWRLEGGLWVDLVPLSEIKGDKGNDGAAGHDGAAGADGLDGADGKEIELQKSDTHIQWRYIGASEWVNLVRLADLKGDKGADGEKGSDGAKGQDGRDGKDGAAGADGKEIELRTTATAIEWHYVGEEWRQLVLLSSLKGERGQRGEKGEKGDSFNIDVQLPLSERHLYDNEPEFFSFLATDEGNLYIRQTDVAGVWSDPIPFGKGEDGRSAYRVAVDGGFVGTEEEWLASLNGKEIELRKGVINLEWRYVGSAQWFALVSLESLKGDKGDKGNDGERGTDGAKGEDGADGAAGADGTDGREVQMRVFGDHIQWHYRDETSWYDLIALADLKGAKGDKGEKGNNGVDGSDGLNGIDGQEVELSVNSTHIQWRLGGGAWQDLVPLATLKGEKGDRGATGADGAAGADGEKGETGADGERGLTGADGRAAEFQKSADFVQWRLVGDPAWQNLFPLSEIKGDKGETGNNGADGTNGTNGIDGREVEMRTGDGHIQYRLVGETIWISIIPLADLKGDAGVNSWDAIPDKPTTFNPDLSKTDEQYYTKAEIDQKLGLLAPKENPTFTGTVNVTGDVMATGDIGSEGT